MSRGAVRIRASSETLYREPCFPDHGSTSVSKFTAGLPRNGRSDNGREDGKRVAAGGLAMHRLTPF